MDMPDISVVTDSLSQGIKLSNLNLSPAPEMVGAFGVETEKGNMK
tara:strand:+ start:38185 stop:38319 length:135 start_codon:yes stop_codon:yes gene_type:complete